MSILADGYHFVCSAQQKPCLNFQQIIMHPLQYQHGVEWCAPPILFFDINLHL